MERFICDNVGIPESVRFDASNGAAQLENRYAFKSYTRENTPPAVKNRTSTRFWRHFVPPRADGRNIWWRPSLRPGAEMIARVCGASVCRAQSVRSCSCRFLPILCSSAIFSDVINSTFFFKSSLYWLRRDNHLSCFFPWNYRDIAQNPIPRWEKSRFSAVTSWWQQPEKHFFCVHSWHW